MVVQSVALPKARDEEIATAMDAAAAMRSARVARVRAQYAHVLVPLLIVTQAAWLMLLGYGVFRYLL
jgi:hypothetical protein